LSRDTTAGELQLERMVSVWPYGDSREMTHVTHIPNPRFLQTPKAAGHCRRI
jgi:hypothetical protein